MSESCSLNGDISNGSSRYTSAQFHARMGKKIQDLYDSEKLCDVTIDCDGDLVEAHRVVLSAASDYFAAMFTSDMNESKQRVIKIREVESRALKNLLRFCYTGSLEMDPQNVEELLRGACLLQLPEVVDACGDFLTHQLHPTNCLGIRQFAEIQNCNQLHRAAHAYALANFTSVTKTEEFLLLGETELFELLSSDSLNVSTEAEVFEALRCWLYHNQVSRGPKAGHLLKSVRLTFLSPQFLADRIENDPILAENRLARSQVVDAYKYHLLPERRLSLSCSLRPRLSTVGCVFVIAGGNAHRGSLSIERYDPLKDHWTTVGEMTGRRLQFGVAVIQEKIYVVGGRDGLKTLNSFDTWDPTRGQWHQMPSMMTPRHGLGVAVLEGTLYACGGHDGWAYLCSVERWDPETNGWSFVADMKAARNTAGVAVLDGRVYAVGGRDSSQVLRSVEKYNPHTNKWTEVASMNRRRGNVGVGVLNGFIYAVGGMDAPASNPGSARFDCVERYDPKTDRWTLVACLSCGRDGVSVCPLGDRLLAIGGFDGQNYLSIVEIYDPEHDSWNMLASLRNGRAGSGVIVLPTEVCADVRPSSCESKIRPSTSALFSANPASQHHHHHNTLPIKPPTGNNIGNIEIKSE